MVLKVVLVIIRLPEMVWRHFFQVVATTGQAFAGGLVEGVEQIQPVEVQLTRCGRWRCIVFLQHLWGALGREVHRQRVVERHPMPQYQDQLTPEARAANLLDRSGQRGVAGNLMKENFHDSVLERSRALAPALPQLSTGGTP
ncbi:hypothetical protein D3C76_989190 [compost metagenome]